QRQPALADPAVERVDLAPVQQELLRPVGIVVGAVPLAVLVDVGADEPGLTVAHLGVRLPQARTAVAERLHLGPLELQARLEPVEQLIVVPRPPVVHDRLLALVLCHRRTSVGSAPWSSTTSAAPASASCPA